MRDTVYIQFKELAEVTSRDVLLKDVARVYCRNTAKQEKCSGLPVMHIQKAEKHRYVANALKIIAMVEAPGPWAQRILWWPTSPRARQSSCGSGQKLCLCAEYVFSALPLPL